MNIVKKTLTASLLALSIGNAFAKLVTECELVAQMLVNEQKFNALKEGQKT